MRKQFDFQGNFKKYLIISGSVFLIGLIMCFVFGPVLSIAYKGGTKLTYSFTGEIDHGAVTSAVGEVFDKNITVSDSTDITGGSQKLIVSLADNESLATETIDAINSKLYESFPDNELENVNTQSVSATMGTRFFMKSLYTVLVAAVLVIIYVAIRFRKIGGVSAGITAMIALVHDILVAFFICVIFRLPIDDNFMAVVLMLLGYSLNDTIVIYDRIRENRRMFGSKMPLGELVNLSNNQVLGRSVMTSVTTFVAVLTVLIVVEAMGLTSLRSMLIPLMFGLISGSYSSICIAPPIWVKWQEHKAAKEAQKAKNPAKKSAKAK
jgi:preprotein translocase subunit SecF